MITKCCANINENDPSGHKQDILKSLTFFWTDENNIRITNLKDFSVAFLSRDHLTRMMIRFTVLNDTEKAIMMLVEHLRDKSLRFFVCFRRFNDRLRRVV